MEGKDKFEELIIAYLLDELDAEKEKHVLDRVNSDIECRKHFEELSSTLKLIGLKDIYDKVNVENEWRNFEQARLRREHPVIFMNEAERFGNEVIKEVKLKRKTKIFKIISVAAVAASIILAVGLGWSLLHQEQKVQPPVAETTKQKPETDKPLTRRLTNTSGIAKEFILEDGTHVMLSDKSELSFKEPFDKNKRDVRLKGKASFRVAKDKTRPFTVFSGDISTTALGTCFTVSAFDDSNKIIVTLHEGKIVVRGREWINGKKVKSYYLSPGQEVVFNKSRRDMTVHVSGAEKISVKESDPVESMPVPGSPADQPSIPAYGKGSWYMFNNQSLANVFDQLADMYNAEISYSRKDISKIYFIGTFSKTDSLESVLKQIAAVNNLKLTREHNKFIISK